MCKTKEGEYEENSVVSFPCIIHIAVTFCAIVAIKIKCGVLDGYSGIEGGLLKLRTKFYMRISLPPFRGACVCVCVISLCPMSKIKGKQLNPVFANLLKIVKSKSHQGPVAPVLGVRFIL